jgi:hypothetical protein
MAGKWAGMFLALCVFGLFGVALASPSWSPRSGGEVPFGALVGGKESDGARLYICRGSYGGSVYPGKIRAALGGCIVPWNGGEVSLPSYEVLTPGWVQAMSGSIPLHAVQFGFEPRSERGPLTVPLYVCRARYEGGLHPGKLRADHGGCNIAWGGREITVASYEVLVNPESIPTLKMPASRGIVPDDAFVGGQEDDGSQLFPCSALYQDGVYPGKVRAEYGGCIIPWDGGAVTIASYQVLIPQ